jgi:hypothetical protein
MGELHDYVREYWRHGTAAYGRGRFLMNAVIGSVGTAALFGLQWLVPAIPIWVAPAWLGTWVLWGLMVAPFRMWKDQRAQIAALKLELRSEPAPDWTIKELFFHIRPEGPPGEIWWTTIGQDVVDRFATNQLHVWGRRKNLANINPPLRLIPSDYWESGFFTYSFLHEDDGTVAHASGIMDVNPYHDLRVNQAEALRIWPRR